ncbi:MAG TPA: ATPase, T2SS/T4P/T4SS family, partial [Vicinamibacterales bacterium]|nr:ATPase, T2SS/T4P/T4SS family [Vicinamibacterales bacterium]
MPLVTSLLTAIVRANGDALVLHAGERPYIVAPSGQSELASRALTLDAVKGMLNELLPLEARKALDEIGAVQHDLGTPAFAPGQSFSVVAARGGDDIWIEIRRHRKPVSLAAPVEAAAPPPPPPPPSPPPEPEPAVAPSMPIASAFAPGASADTSAWQTSEPEPEPELEPEPGFSSIEVNLDLAAVEVPEPAFAPIASTGQAWEPDPQLGTRNLEPGTPDGPIIEQVMEIEQENYDIGTAAEVHEISLDLGIDRPSSIVDRPTSVVEEPAPVVEEPAPVVEEPAPVVEPPAPLAAETPVRVADRQPSTMDRRSPIDDGRWTIDDGRSAVVLPLSRHQVRGDQSARFTPALQAAGIDRLLRIAAARGASTLYLTSQSRPSIRVDGEISAIDGESVLSEGDVETLILDMIPERNREALRSQAGTEWICDVADVGRIRCVTFRDHRGAGGIFHMIPARASSAEQLGLSREIQGLCAEADGLVLVAGPRSSGKSTLISAFVDLINRTRSEYIITIENQVKFVHENRGSLVSQREVRGDRNELLAVARAALRENPDVLVVEDFGFPEIVALALDAAQSGHLVIGAMTAHTATDAVDRIIDATLPELRGKVQLGLAENLRGIVSQALLRKTGGGRVAAREVL